MTAQHARRIRTGPVVPIPDSTYPKHMARITVWKTNGINRHLPVQYTVTDAKPPAFRIDDASGITARALLLIITVGTFVGWVAGMGNYLLGICVTALAGAAWFQVREQHTITVADRAVIEDVLEAADNVAHSLARATAPTFASAVRAQDNADAFVDALNRRDLDALTRNALSPIQRALSQDPRAARAHSLAVGAETPRAEPSPFDTAGAALAAHDRRDDSTTVAQVGKRLKALPVRDQTTMSEAAAAITSMYAELDTLPGRIANEPNSDGQTPRAVVNTSIDAVMVVLRTAADASYQPHTDAIRAWRSYVRRWEPDESPLNLDRHDPTDGDQS